MNDTIYALASARGKAGVAVIRVSGSQAYDIARKISSNLPSPGSFGLRRLLAGDGSLIDEGLVLVFAGGASFTGEPVVEFQLHGSLATIRAMLNRLAELGLRSAEPGEFTRRALENGRLDLTQVEGLADLIEAETEAQRKLALKSASGLARELVESWRRDLIRATALIEATIDFAEEDVPEDVSDEVELLLKRVLNSVLKELAGSTVSERIREGFEVAIVGAPNVGKSTLLNRLAGREAALTSERAGTTRDIIELRMDMRGLAVTWLDTAGLRETDDEIEALGIERARARAEAADLRVFLVDVGQDPAFPPKADDIVMLGKSDLTQLGGVSGKTGDGLDALVDKVTGVLSERATAATTMSHQRHRDSLVHTQAALEAALDLLKPGLTEPELIAESLREANHALSFLIGLVDVEHVLDEIFSSFCIGK